MELHFNPQTSFVKVGVRLLEFAESWILEEAQEHLHHHKVPGGGAQTMKAAIASLFLLAVTTLPVGAHRSNVPYEIWGSDQSNSVAGAESRGVDGSFIWVWRSTDVIGQIISRGRKLASPVGCDGQNRPGDGPCDVKDVFPGTLREYDSMGATNAVLGDYTYGRLHGMLVDPQNRYMNANLFGPGNGFIGIIDGATKEAVAIFRVTATTAGQRVHMSFWNSDGTAILIANLNGKVLERIDITRDVDGKIVDAVFNQSAGLGVGSGLSIEAPAKVYLGTNAQGNDLIGSVAGSYDDADLGDVTPAGFCRENGCGNAADGSNGGRVNNVIICPIVSSRNNAYITFGGGGLLVADTTTTPMSIVGEYGQEIVNGAGCGGAEALGHMWLNAGVSAAGAGADQSTFTIYKIDDRRFPATGENQPEPVLVFKDSNNTATTGNIEGEVMSDLSGQLPGLTTRRDSHGMAATHNERYMHTVDRIQNVVEVFHTRTHRRFTYDLTSRNGRGGGTGVCNGFSVQDDEGLPINDPAPDLMEATPDGYFMAVAFRGPVPVSVTHSAQGSCPGVGIVALRGGGRFGRLATVLRTNNTLDDTPVDAPGGYDYMGSEHSDVHGASVRTCVEMA